ncbi:hypothetical protein BCR44DRAFT_1430953 [Catenaria anguillulae PL171]|uniref:Uncharacterized protein n=1 Tax=Catenaria anguillulae PL171 TaxID=765915 RepID=A0A1Y2HS23_9FUNG|nr:hypothetical protein BCR44DRAFT_1430953 [Catenaria anguillulae PL171]
MPPAAILMPTNGGEIVDRDRQPKRAFRIARYRPCHSALGIPLAKALMSRQSRLSIGQGLDETVISFRKRRDGCFTCHYCSYAVSYIHYRVGCFLALCVKCNLRFC